MNTIWRLLCSLSILACAFLVLPPQPVHAAGIVVNTLGDTDVNDGDCSLREAIWAARSNAAYNGCPAGVGDDTITFSVSGTITLASTLPSITTPANGKITINGGNVITIDGAAVDENIFDVNNGLLELQNIVLTNGKYAVRSLYGTVVLDHVTISNVNRSDSYGVFSQSTPLTVKNSTFSSNRGGIFAMRYIDTDPYPLVTIQNSTFTGNSDFSVSLAAANGVIENSTLSNNTFSAVLCQRQLSVSGSTFTNNAMAGSSGAAIQAVLGTVTVTTSVFTGNHSYRGGAVTNSAGTMDISRSTFANNEADNNGGAIYSDSGTLIVSDSTFVENIAHEADSQGGAIYSGNNAEDITLLTNLTVASNTAAYGPGVYIWDGHLTLKNSTFSANHITKDNSDFAVVMRGLNGTNLITNNIFSGAIGGSNCNWNVANISNTFSTDGSCDGATQVTADALHLGTLNNYGGSVRTIPLLPGSVAINAGNNTTCTLQDARGIARPQLTTCDAGAFESRGFTLTRTTGNAQTAMIFNAFSIPLGVNITNAFSEPVNGGVITFSAPASGASLTFAPNTSVTIVGFKASMNVIPGSTASLAVTANSIPGSYTVSAQTSGGSAVLSYALTNDARLIFLPLISR
jgi:CSLREA domain-containing protein